MVMRITCIVILTIISHMGLLNEGQRIRGTYEVERLIGEGAFAEVYRVKHRFLGRQAMKVFKIVGMTAEETERMLGEAIMLSRIGHPNIVRVYDANTIETSKGTCGFFTMEYVAGGSLEQFWRSHGAAFVPVETAVNILKQVCRGLALAHAQNPPIVHRDIKPQNILVGYDADGLRARISDFGLAKNANPLTLMVSGRGTLLFKPPEVMQDWQSDSCAGDVWALGQTLYLLLTDRMPFGDVQVSDARDPSRFQDPLIPASRLNIQTGSFLDRILERALARDPGERYPTARELLDELEKWRPEPTPGGKSAWGTTSSGLSKTALGPPQMSANQDLAEQMARQAVELARQAARLKEAADTMEEAFNKWPSLRERYEYRLTLWRRGVCTPESRGTSNG
jgi:serine/threonine-protein kinase